MPVQSCYGKLFALSIKKLYSVWFKWNEFKCLTNSGGAEISELSSTLKFKSLSEEIMPKQIFFFFFTLPIISCSSLLNAKILQS